MLLEIRINIANAILISQLNNGYSMETGKKEVLKDIFGLKTQNCLMEEALALKLPIPRSESELCHLLLYV